MKLIAIFLAIALVGCAASNKMSRVSEGMSQAAVESIWGAPDGFHREGDFAGLQYNNLLMHNTSYDRADYSFIFENDRLVSWGVGEVREKTQEGLSTLFLYSIN